MKKTLLILASLLLSSSIMAENLKIISLNLHGYHPMGEKKRYLEDKAGKKHLTSSHIHYFKVEEFTRGNKRRINHLARDLSLLSPDIIFLQEVGAGGPHQNDKNCINFYQKFDQDNDYENTSFRLERRLRQLDLNYTNLPACRGNLGWYTGPNQFNDYRVVTEDGSVIFDYKDNPYPYGILIEGSSIMVSKRFKVLKHIIYNDPYNYLGHKFFYQMAVIKHKKSKDWFLLVNIHAAHKITHFEQSLLIKKNIIKYLTNHYFEGDFKGILIGGDFNATLYRPQDKISEVSTIFYEVKNDNHFDFFLDGRNDRTKLNYLRDELTTLNWSNYKPWATIQDENEFNLRLDHALDSFYKIQKEFLESPYKDMLLMDSSLDMANSLNRCSPVSILDGDCKRPGRIDFIMKTKNLEILNSSILYSKNNWTSLDYITDHPGILATLEF